MLRAGPLQPVLTGLLNKDPLARTTAEAARRQLTAVLAGTPPTPLPPPPPDAAPTPAPAPVSAGLPSARVERIDADDLRALASASKSLLSSVARDARDQARYLAERRRERKGENGPVPAGPSGAPPAAPRRRWRFKRRWVVVPVLVTLVVVVLVLVGLGFLVASALGLI
jgi:hypothetical protein